MGFAGTGYALYPERLKNQTMSVGAFDQMVQRVLSENPEADFDAIAPVITQAFGLIAKNRPKNNPLSVTNEEKKELENAFKHGVSYQEPSFIHITMDVFEGKLRYLVVNSSHKAPEGEPHGIGLENVHKRLQLIYDQQYTLDIQTRVNEYQVLLLIPLQL